MKTAIKTNIKKKRHRVTFGRFYNPVTEMYYKVRVEHTPNGKKGRVVDMYPAQSKK